MSTSPCGSPLEVCDREKIVELVEITHRRIHDQSITVHVKVFIRKRQGAVGGILQRCRYLSCVVEKISSPNDWNDGEDQSLSSSKACSEGVKEIRNAQSETLKRPVVPKVLGSAADEDDRRRSTSPPGNLMVLNHGPESCSDPSDGSQESVLRFLVALGTGLPSFPNLLHGPLRRQPQGQARG